MTDSIDPYASPKAGDSPSGHPAIPVNASPSYRPWSRGRTYVIFILGMHAVSFMMFFFHPVFPIFGLAFGIPAYITANREIAEIPEAEHHPFIKWGKRGGLIGLIGGPIAIVLWILVVVIIAAVA